MARRDDVRAEGLRRARTPFRGGWYASLLGGEGGGEGGRQGGREAGMAADREAGRQAADGAGVR